MPTHKLVAEMSEMERRDFLKCFLDDVFVTQRSRLLAYASHTHQTAQVDSDGYLAQIIASIVLGVQGNSRRGKSGVHPGDLSDGTEVKSAYRVEQMNGKEDSHVNFGQITREKMREFLNGDRAVILHTAYDAIGRVKIEVIELDLTSTRVVSAVEEFLNRSTSDRPQLQPRLYPDGKRDVLQVRPGHFVDLGARLLARAVVVGDEVVIDKWAPSAGLPLDDCLDLCPGGAPTPTEHHIQDPWSPDEFFVECMIRHRRALIPYCAATEANQNVGFGNLAQHLVSIVTGIQGTKSGARGLDLADGSEIKLAMGHRGDPLGTEDFPRLNLQKNVKKMLSWTALYPVRIVCDDEGLKVKVFKAPTETFKEQVEDYFGPLSAYSKSANLQYHAPKTFDSNVFTGKRGDRTERALECEVLYCAEELADGSCRSHS